MKLSTNIRALDKLSTYKALLMATWEECAVRLHNEGGSHTPLQMYPHGVHTGREC